MNDQDELVFKALAILIGGDGSKKLQPARLINRLAKATSLVQTDIQQSLARLGQSGKLVGVNARGEPEQRVGWSDPSLQPIPEYVLSLQRILDEMTDEVSTNEASVILRAASIFEGFDIHVMKQLVKAIITYTRISEVERTQSQDKFIHSARNFLSSSKALDGLSKILTGLGCDIPRDSPVYYALTAGNPNGTFVLFIENPRVFDYLAPHVDKYDAMIVSSYGYGLTLANIGDLLESDRIKTTSVDHYPNSSLSSSLSVSRCLYWGDLDYEGVVIYESLKKSIPQIALSGAYSLMLELLKEKKGHPYHKLFGKSGQKPSVCRTHEGQILMDVCSSVERGIDQEAVCTIENIGTIFSELILQQLTDSL